MCDCAKFHPESLAPDDSKTLALAWCFSSRSFLGSLVTCPRSGACPAEPKTAISDAIICFLHPTPSVQSVAQCDTKAITNHRSSFRQKLRFSKLKKHTLLSTGVKANPT